MSDLVSLKPSQTLQCTELNTVANLRESFAVDKSAGLTGVVFDDVALPLCTVLY